MKVVTGYRKTIRQSCFFKRCTSKGDFQNVRKKWRRFYEVPRAQNFAIQVIPEKKIWPLISYASSENDRPLLLIKTSETDDVRKTRRRFFFSLFFFYPPPLQICKVNMLGQFPSLSCWREKSNMNYGFFSLTSVCDTRLCS